jgi:hypothetical protein
MAGTGGFTGGFAAGGKMTGGRGNPPAGGTAAILKVDYRRRRTMMRFGCKLPVEIRLKWFIGNGLRQEKPPCYVDNRVFRQL